MATLKLGSLAPNPKNPRTITDEKKRMLIHSMKEFGDLSGVIYNRKTKQLVGGHQRTSILDAASVVEIVKKYEKPTPTGTVAEGFIISGKERFNYREVSWSEAKEKAANLAANKGAGDWDMTAVTAWMRELDELDFDLDLTMFDKDERIQFLADIEKINSGSENDEWARMDGEHSFEEGEKYIGLVINFPSEKERQEFIDTIGLRVTKKTRATWSAEPQS